MRGLPEDLHPGDPVCSPKHTVIAEECIQLVRRLHEGDRKEEEIFSHMNQSQSDSYSWTDIINRLAISRLHNLEGILHLEQVLTVIATSKCIAKTFHMT